jgi:2-amino-4-hydroxy-6-hydroxymethyldihydropteridine diphosphokinase
VVKYLKEILAKFVHHCHGSENPSISLLRRETSTNDIMRTMNGIKPVDVYLALGSNLGNREANLLEALRLLSERLQVVMVSPVYETNPEGGEKQPRYLNQAAHIMTSLPPEELLVLAKGFELKMGRTSPSGAPRVIDIDILLYGKQVIKSPGLTIPHPRLAKRGFVLIPLADIAPDAQHPVEHKTIKVLRDELKDNGGVIKVK